MDSGVRWAMGALLAVTLLDAVTYFALDRNLGLWCTSAERFALL